MARLSWPSVSRCCRFIAVTQPIRYSKQKSSSRGTYLGLIALAWLVSLAVSSPIALGMNYTQRRRLTPTLCTFYHSDDDDDVITPRWRHHAGWRHRDVTPCARSTTRTSSSARRWRPSTFRASLCSYSTAKCSVPFDRWRAGNTHSRSQHEPSRFV